MSRDAVKKRRSAVVSATLGWLVLVTAQPRTSSATVVDRESAARSLLAPAQTIRFQPVDSTHVRLRLEGRENWIVDSAGFSFPRSKSPDFVVVVSTPGLRTVRTPGALSSEYQVELSIGRLGTAAPSFGISMSNDAKAQENYPASGQTIRIEPVDTAHLRLHLVGRDNLSVDSAEFSVLPDVDFVRVVAAPGRNAITTAGSSRVAQTFELSVTPSGSVRIQSADSRRR